jgi:glycosyltransferase involved in cell wall biosynthesis
LKVLVVAPVPPPHLGLTIMVERIVKSSMRGFQIRCVPLNLATEGSEIGKLRLMKVLWLLPIVLCVVWARLRFRPDILYYAPAGRGRLTVYRDFFVLLATRWMFPATVFHFQSSGLSEQYAELPRWQRWMFRRAYYDVEAAIRLSEYTHEDAKALRAQREYIIPNASDDPCPDWRSSASEGPVTAQRPLRILFMAILRESKGLGVLLDACGQLAARGVPFALEVVGKFGSPQFEQQVTDQVARLGIARHVSFTGELLGEDKFRAFCRADVFCLPTFYADEAFPVVLVEAMSCGLPILSTRWRGIQSMIEQDASGILVEPRDADAVAREIARLAADPQFRQRLAAGARQRYLQQYTLEQYVERVRQVFLDVAGVAQETAPAKENVEPCAV